MKEKKTNGKAKVIAPVIAVIVVIVAAVAIFMHTSASAQEQDPDAGTTVDVSGGAEPSAEVTANPEETDTPDADVDEPPEESAAADLTGAPQYIVEHYQTSGESVPDMDSEGGWVVYYTGIETSKQSLVQMVRETVAKARLLVDMNVQESNGEDALQWTIVSLVEDIRDGVIGDFDDPFVSHCVRDGERVEMDRFAEDRFYSGWSYMEWCGSVGEYLFRSGNDLYFDNYRNQKSNLLQRFVAYGIFDANVDDMGNWELMGVYGVQFMAMYDVNYLLSFSLNGTSYKAVIGNMNGQYVLLDVMKPSDAIPEDEVINDIVDEAIESAPPVNSAGVVAPTPQPTPQQPQNPVPPVVVVTDPPETPYVPPNANNGSGVGAAPDGPRPDGYYWEPYIGWLPIPEDHGDHDNSSVDYGGSWEGVYDPNEPDIPGMI